jgi:hypothetical protein
MVVVDMHSTPPKVIGRKVCLQDISLYRLSKDPRPKKIQTFEGRKNRKK